MTWVKLPDEWLDSSDVERIGALATFLHIAALSWSNRAGARGFISETRAVRLTTLQDPEALIDRLVEAGLWDRVDGGYQITEAKGLLRHQLTPEQVETYKTKAAERQKRRRDNQRMAMENELVNEGHGVSHGEHHGVSHAPPSSSSSSSSFSTTSTFMPADAGGTRKRAPKPPSAPDKYDQVLSILRTEWRNSDRPALQAPTGRADKNRNAVNDCEQPAELLAEAWALFALGWWDCYVPDYLERERSLHAMVDVLGVYLENRDAIVGAYNARNEHHKVAV